MCVIGIFFSFNFIKKLNSTMLIRKILKKWNYAFIIKICITLMDNIVILGTF